MKSITRRWLYNSFTVILLVLLVLEVGFVFFIRSYYYSSIKQTVMSRASVVSNLLLRYAEDQTTDFSSEVRNMVENFADKDMMELLAINAAGMIVISSSGFEPVQQSVMPDYEAAKSSAKGVGEYQGKLDSSENIYAITILSPVHNQEFSALRFIVSMEKTDRQILFNITAFTLVIIIIIFSVIFSSSYFIRSIVRPLSQVGNTAKKIAAGDLEARIENNYHDEIGELCDMINYMAGELSEADIMKNEFISSVSHELRTPLTAIRGWGETILAGDTSDKQMIDKGMQVIIKETERLSAMVEELLDFSKIQSGHFTIVKNKIDILAELEEAILVFVERAKREGILFEYNEPQMLSPVFGDKNRLRQVFVNVIDNAIKYSENGGIIKIDAREQYGLIYITVSDTGCGISEYDLPRIKTKFYKGNSTRRGSGIGLAVADEIVAMHDGTLEIESEKDVGTTVTICLPVINSAKMKE